MNKIAMMALIAFAAVTASATQFSKLSIITTAKSLGQWQALKAWIVAADVQEEWDAAAYLSDEYGMFPAVTNSIITAGIATQEEVETILAASVDPSVPDALLRRVYSNDCTTASGRVKWHGAKLSETVDTNTLTKVTVYADGMKFTDEAKVTTPAQAAQAQLERLPKRAMTNGVPVALANARQRQIENESKTNVVTVVLQSGK